MTSQLRTTAPRDCHSSAQLRPPLKGLPSRATACRYVYTGPGGVSSLATDRGPLEFIEVLHLFRWYTHTHTPSFTRNFVTHTHTYIHTYILTYIHTCILHIFSHTFLLCRTPSFTSHFVTHNCFNFSILHHLLCLSFLPRPRYNLWSSLLEEVDLWGSPVLYFFFAKRWKWSTECFKTDSGHNLWIDMPFFKISIK